MSPTTAVAPPAASRRAVARPSPLPATTDQDRPVLQISGHSLLPRPAGCWLTFRVDDAHHLAHGVQHLGHGDPQQRWVGIGAVRDLRSRPRRRSPGAPGRPAAPIGPVAPVRRAAPTACGSWRRRARCRCRRRPPAGRRRRWPAAGAADRSSIVGVPLAAATRSASDRSAGPPVITTRWPSRLSWAATSANRSAGHRRDTAAAPGCTRVSPSTTSTAGTVDRTHHARPRHVGQLERRGRPAGTSARPRARPRTTADPARRPPDRRSRRAGRAAARPAAAGSPGPCRAGRRQRRPRVGPVQRHQLTGGQQVVDRRDVAGRAVRTPPVRPAPPNGRAVPA